MTEEGLMIQAAAFRAKYRKLTPNGTPVQLTVPVGSLGVHEQNRGGAYPSGNRCLSLCEAVLNGGFSAGDVNHNCVVVEECPPDEIRSRGEGFVSAIAYSFAASRKDEHLRWCFTPPDDKVQYRTVSHSHIMLILRGFLPRQNGN